MLLSTPIWTPPANFYVSTSPDYAMLFGTYGYGWRIQKGTYSYTKIGAGGGSGNDVRSALWTGTNMLIACSTGLIRISTDQGATWADATGYFYREPIGFVHDIANERIYCFFTNSVLGASQNRPTFIYSDDDGATWTTVEQILHVPANTTSCYRIPSVAFNPATREVCFTYATYNGSTYGSGVVTMEVFDFDSGTSLHTYTNTAAQEQAAFGGLHNQKMKYDVNLNKWLANEYKNYSTGAEPVTAMYSLDLSTRTELWTPATPGYFQLNSWQDTAYDMSGTSPFIIGGESPTTWNKRLEILDTSGTITNDISFDYNHYRVPNPTAFNPNTGDWLVGFVQPTYYVSGGRCGMYVDWGNGWEDSSGWSPTWIGISYADGYSGSWQGPQCAII